LRFAVFISGEVPAIPTEGLDALLPPWAQGLSLVSLLIIIIVAWVRGWVVSKAEYERGVAAERRVSDIWEANFNGATQLNQQLTQAFAPVLEQNEAILKAVEAVQEEQRRMRDRRPGR
jgi:hypothetical protein